MRYVRDWDHSPTHNKTKYFSIKMLQALISSLSSKCAHLKMKFCFKQQQNTSSSKTLRHEEEKTPYATELQKCICLTFGKTLDLTLFQLAVSAVYYVIKAWPCTAFGLASGSGLPVNKGEVERNAGHSPLTSDFHMSKSQMLCHCFRGKML